ncbi:terpenoid cyclases/protein prenyltransferase alpha-alpha toroid, partial [Blyttiomyces helicus]
MPIISPVTADSDDSDSWESVSPTDPLRSSSPRRRTTPLADALSEDDSLPTESSDLQRQVEDSIYTYYAPYKDLIAPMPIDDLPLHRAAHSEYVNQGLKGLGPGFCGLDASRPWLGGRGPQTCWLGEVTNATGGFGGGPGQLSHLAGSYAAVNVLAIIGTKEAFEVVNRKKYLEWLLSLKQPDGSFVMHIGGERDVRGTYCALASAKLLNLLTPELVDGVAEFVVRCQSYEGGISCRPGNEAHGGYTFCALAAMEILGKAELLDLDALT